MNIHHSIRIDVVPGNCLGTKWVVVNDDRKHTLTKYCVNRQEVMDAMLAIHVAMAEQLADAPTRKSAIIDPAMMYAEAMTEANTRFAANQCPLSTGTVTEVTKLRDGRVVRVAMMVELFVDQDAIDTYDDDTYGNGGL